MPISQVQNIGLGLICYKIVQLKLSVTHLKGINDLNRRAEEKGFLFILWVFGGGTQTSKTRSTHAMCCRTQHLVTHPFTCWAFSFSYTWPWKDQKSGLESAGGIRTAVWENREDTHSPGATQGSQTWSWPDSKQQKSLNKAWVLIITPVWTFKLLKRPAFLLHRAPAQFATAKIWPSRRESYRHCSYI